MHVRSWQGAYPGLIPQTYLDALRPEDRRAGWEEVLSATDWPRRGVLLLLGPTPPGPVPPEPRPHPPVVGFTSVGPSRDDDADPATVGEIETIYLDPVRFGTGDGDLLMGGALSTLRAAGYRRATLWMLATNARAGRFYLRHGWRPDGARQRHDWGSFVATDVRLALELG